MRHACDPLGSGLVRDQAERWPRQPLPTLRPAWTHRSTTFACGLISVCWLTGTGPRPGRLVARAELGAAFLRIDAIETAVCYAAWRNLRPDRSVRRRPRDGDSNARAEDVRGRCCGQPGTPGPAGLTAAHVLGPARRRRDRPRRCGRAPPPDRYAPARPCRPDRPRLGRGRDKMTTGRPDLDSRSATADGEGGHHATPATPIRVLRGR
jgi:hypothetical protein